MLFPSLFPFLLSSGEANTIAYDMIKAYGESTLDEWSTYNTDVSNANIQSYAQSSTPTWEFNTILLAHLDSNFDAGNFPAINRPVTQWRILRKIYGSTDEFQQIGLIDNNNVNLFNDTTASANTSYVYAIQAVSNGIRGSAITAIALAPDESVLEAIKLAFFGWRLSSTDGNTTYSFYVDLESDNIVTNRARTMYETIYSQFPKVEVGNARYRSGSLNTRPIDEIDGQYFIGNNANRDTLENFLQNGEPKILKNGSGLTMLVDCHSVSIKYDDVLFNSDYSQPYMISFNYVEIGLPSEV